jgi:ATP-dependent Lon protease
MKLFETKINHAIPEILPIVPTIDVVVFPHMIIPLLIVDEKIIEGINQSMENGNKLVVIVTCKKQSDKEHFSISPQDLFSIGTVTQIIKVIPTREGTTKILVQGIARVKITDIKVDDTLSGNVSVLPYEFDEKQTPKYHEKINLIKTLMHNLSEHNQYSKEMQIGNYNIPEKVIDYVITQLSLNVLELQKLLEASSYELLFELVIEFIMREIEIAKIQQKAKNKARESINNNQKEFYVREQIRALKEELGETTEEIDTFRQKLYNIEDIFPEESFKEILQCINRLENMSSESAEAGILRTYLECIFDLPWETETKDNPNIVKAKKILDEEHYGLNHIKERILDYLSVRQLSKTALSTIICLYGPPGVGKTSLAESIAKAIGRKSFRISVGGMKDEAEIRGHRRTYVGAMPGRIIKGLRQVQVKNPLIIVDEIDKISSEFRGDPASALLEVFDYQQNHNFYDYYLGIPFNLSQVFFIATANSIENIPSALRDRMEMIELSSYSHEEKKHIATNYLIKKNLKESGLQNKQVQISTEIIETIINSYTYEAGVRDLDRWLKKLYFKIARALVENNKIPEVNKENLETFLGAPRFIDQGPKKIERTGVSQGLCYTSCGGEVLYIESMLTSGQGKLTLTGQLGDVMKESAHIAHTFIKAHYKEFGISEDKINTYDIHVHVPAGAIPKDGPSAGVALFASMYSALTSIIIKQTFAMTGEIDLQGLVLPVGGIKEKVLAAKKAGAKIVFIPSQNKYNVAEIAPYLGNDIEIRYIDHIQEVIETMFHQNSSKETIKKQEENVINQIEEKLINEFIEIPISHEIEASEQ